MESDPNVIGTFSSGDPNLIESNLNIDNQGEIFRFQA